MRDSWGSIISTLKQDAVAHSPLDPKVLSAAITKLGSEQSCDARKEEVGEDLAFLAQLVLRECSDEEQPVGVFHAFTISNSVLDAGGDTKPHPNADAALFCCPNSLTGPPQGSIPEACVRTDCIRAPGSWIVLELWPMDYA
eukprot:1145873-Pelagomonas_calceolata.AAC.2